MSYEEDLKIEKFTESDFEFYFKLVGNAKVMAMITERALSEDEAKDEFSKIVLNNELHSFLGTYKITGSSSNNFIGFVKLTIQKPNDTEAELGYMLLPEYWGKGIAGVMARNMIKRSRSLDQLTRIKAIIDPNNIPSKKILLNSGFSSVRFVDFDGLPGEILELQLNRPLD
ncbi:GNAT family N-acetyltransferase [Maribellus sp. CM-23]|uniref:GNAT family N-acetyltransferase n=1 Tax=Maribellus sp. CM-23 TaxID=2781026 RepID=UPI001F39038F|nr:GNAT family N-acetyltransferase [Maribellus sp. CM-23]MCE4563183.1 GNAT family N-acetyltransferase [Maribellus sp. CM-23]